MITPFYVTSSNINCIGYDNMLGSLYIRFNSGESYMYADVPQDVFDALLCAESVGQTFHSTVKNKYSFTKLTASPFDEVRKVEPIEEAAVAA